MFATVRTGWPHVPCVSTDPHLRLLLPALQRASPPNWQKKVEFRSCAVISSATSILRLSLIAGKCAANVGIILMFSN